MPDTELGILEMSTKKIKSMEDTDLMFAYKNRSGYDKKFVELLVEEFGIRGYDVAEIEKMSLKDIDALVIKDKSSDELIEIYQRCVKYKESWKILAKEELKNRGIDVEELTGEKIPMFKGCFSFSGRIRRLEYALSVLIYIPCVFIVRLFEAMGMESMMFLLLIPAIWFLLSQGARRCHDFGYSGLWQLVPLYVIIMLYFEGDFGENKYGENPKGEGNYTLEDADM